MHESRIEDFFREFIDASRLNEDIEDPPIEGFLDWRQLPPDAIANNINLMGPAFRVEPEHLVRLCDAVLAGDLKAEHLEQIGFCLLASAHFFWDESQSGKLVTEAVNHWSYYLFKPTPLEDVEKTRERLLTGIR